MADTAEHDGDLRTIVARGDDTVTQTRDMLPVLREAGVVDAGAAGLVEIVRGIAAALEGKPLPAAPAHERGLGGRGDPPGALALPLLHRLRRRG